MKRFLTVLFGIIAALYPLLVFTCLVLLKLPVRILSLCIVVLAFAFFLGATGNRKNENGKRIMSVRPLFSAGLFLLVGLLCFFSNQTIFLKLYSVVISATLLITFGSTLFFAPNIIFRFATLADKSIIGSVAEKRVEQYCRNVCIVWCIFFIANGSVAAYTAFFASDRVWSVYNGGISYALMGLLFAVEFIIRKQVDKKMPKVFPISQFKADSRPHNHIISYEGTWQEKKYKTWLDFLKDTAKIRAALSQKSAESYILHCEDYYFFLVTFVALLQCKKTIMLTQNISPSFIEEIFVEGTTGFLSDCEAPHAESIPHLIASAPEPQKADWEKTPAFTAEETKILMYTSGSTGHPKAVMQRMAEFEEDNAFVISKWGEAFLSRTLVTTVSQHHIYGFLFGISLPFALGVPFRRKRIEFPEEFETLSDVPYMIIATPAFLKRTVEIEETLPTKDCFIFTSGGVLTVDVAKKSYDTFGFWPVEVYGSTETSGIAYRQSKDGLLWTPFDNAKISLNEEGCLVIVSPYIKDPAGFATADLADIKEDGRFLLLGRKDSIVKIEEKRISLTEVENRLLETGLVQDVKVIALEDRRQYLACALVLNDRAKEQFAGQEKRALNMYFQNYLAHYFEGVVIPKKWRFVDALPADVQGKKHKEDIAKLFAR